MKSTGQALKIDPDRTRGQIRELGFGFCFQIVFLGNQTIRLFEIMEELQKCLGCKTQVDQFLEGKVLMDKVLEGMVLAGKNPLD